MVKAMRIASPANGEPLGERVSHEHIERVPVLHLRRGAPHPQREGEMASALVTQVRNLQRRRARKRSPVAVAEGVRLVEEALAAGVRFEGVVVAQSALDHPRTAGVIQRLAAHAVPVEDVPDRTFAGLADTDSPQGILALIETPTWRLQDLDLAQGGTVLVLDAVQDPGNVGTLIRTAYALGAVGALLLPGTADARNPKVLRGAMGATFRLPALLLTDGEFTVWTRREQVDVWIAATEGRALDRLDRPARVALVVGNEGAGVRASLQSIARQRVAIPLARGAESLNVAVAAGILLYEVSRAG
jgi:TrmH family RNA methyltransferase